MAIPIQHAQTIQDFIDFIMHPDHLDRNFEFIGGEISEVVSNSYSSMVAANILIRIGGYVLQHQLGYVFGADGGYQISEERYIPDASFISYKRQPHPPHEAYNPNPPDLAVEVLSPTDSETSIRIKIANYLAANVVVWVVQLETKVVEVYQPGNAVRIFRANDAITAGDILPGFEVKVSDFFPPQRDESDESTAQ